MAINSYTSDDGTAKVEINDSTWAVKIYDLENSTSEVIDITSDDAEDLDSFITPGFSNGRIMMAIARAIKNALT